MWPNTSGVIVGLHAMGETPHNSVTVHWKEHGDCLRKELWHAFKQDLLVDTNVTFYGNCVRVHRLILSLFLPNFRRTAHEGRTGQALNLDYVASHVEDIQSLIEFAYIGKVTLPQERLQSLKRLAQELDFKGLACSIADCENPSPSDGTSTDQSTRPSLVESNLDSLAEYEVVVTVAPVAELENAQHRSEFSEASSKCVSATENVEKSDPSKQDSNQDPETIWMKDDDAEKQDEDGGQEGNDDDDDDDDDDYSLQSDAGSPEGVIAHMDTAESSDVNSVGGRDDSKRPLKRSKRWTLTCPHCTFITTNNALFITHLSEHYTKETNLEDAQTPRRRTRSQSIAQATTATKNLTPEKKDRPGRTRSKTAAMSGASVASVSATSEVTHSKVSRDVPDSGDDAEEKKRQRAEYQRNYRLARKLVKCNHCSYETRDPTALKAHRVTHASPDSRQISCDKCQKTFLTLQALRFHERTKCGRELRYTCDFCGHRTLHRETWRQHLANIHKRDTRGNPLGDDIKCPHCDYVCCARHQLQLHLLRKHTVDKPFKCDKCEYSAVRRSELAKHVSIQHLKERNYMCDVCGFRSQTSNGLYSHVRSKHSGIKLYRCDVCGKEYNCHTSFKVHKQKHTGDVKLYVCHVCGHSCNKRTNLRSHMRRIHSVELESLKKNYAPREPHSNVAEVGTNADVQSDYRHDIKQEFSSTILAQPSIGISNRDVTDEEGEVLNEDDNIDGEGDNSMSDPNMVTVGAQLLHSVFTHMVDGEEPVIPL